MDPRWSTPARQSLKEYIPDHFGLAVGFLFFEPAEPRAGAQGVLTPTSLIIERCQTIPCLGKRRVQGDCSFQVVYSGFGVTQGLMDLALDQVAQAAARNGARCKGKVTEHTIVISRLEL